MPLWLTDVKCDVSEPVGDRAPSAMSDGGREGSVSFELLGGRLCGGCWGPGFGALQPVTFVDVRKRTTKMAQTTPHGKKKETGDSLPIMWAWRQCVRDRRRWSVIVLGESWVHVFVVMI